MRAYKYIFVLIASFIVFSISSIGQEDTYNCEEYDAVKAVQSNMGVLCSWCDESSSGCLLTGETVNLCGPSGDYNYQWTIRIGESVKPGGNERCQRLSVPTNTPVGTAIGAVLTITSRDGLKCMDDSCRIYKVCPSPCCHKFLDYCEKKANQDVLDRFTIARQMPGYAYVWVVDGKKAVVDLNYLNKLAQGVHYATLDIYHNGKFVKTWCDDSWFVAESPVATITEEATDESTEEPSPASVEEISFSSGQ